MIKQFCASLISLLNQFYGLTGTRRDFDTFYERMRAHGIADPQQSLGNFCKLLGQLKEEQWNYISAIAREMQKSHRYTTVERDTMDKLLNVSADSGSALSQDELTFLDFLCMFHVRNIEYGVYDKNIISEF